MMQKILFWRSISQFQVTLKKVEMEEDILYFSLLTERAEMVLIRRLNIFRPKVGNLDKNSSPIFFSDRIFRVILKMQDLWILLKARRDESEYLCIC